MADCLNCKYFISCESGKQIFYKLSGIECDEFEKGGADNGDAESS